MTIRIDGTNTAANPGITGSDTDTGLQFGTDEVKIVTGGTARATVDSSGRLLVGTPSTSTSTRLLLQGNSANATGSTILSLASGTNSPGSAGVLGRVDISDNGHTPAVQILGQRDGGTWTSGSSQPSALVFSTTADGASSPSPRMTIKANGNVGIGTDNPQATLELLDTATNTYLRLSGNSANAQNTNYAGIEFYNSDSSGAGPGVQAWIEARNIGATGVGADLAFGTYPAVSSPEGARGVERMRITGDGYIRLTPNAGGIQFNDDTAAANALDDYEEGTWQPEVNDGTVNYAFARYTKIGRQVTIAARISAFSNRTSANSVVVRNLPFDGDGSNPQAAGSAFFRYVNNQFTTVYVDGDDLQFYRGGSGAFDAMQHQDITDSTCEIYFFATYFIA